MFEVMSIRQQSESFDYRHSQMEAVARNVIMPDTDCSPNVAVVISLFRPLAVISQCPFGQLREACQAEGLTTDEFVAACREADGMGLLEFYCNPATGAKYVISPVEVGPERYVRFDATWID